MNRLRKFRRLWSLVLFVVLGGLSICAEDWTTIDGQVYKSVTVVKTEADAVTIIHQNGGALISLSKLPTDLQKRYNYDPVQAKVAADARAKADAENAKTLLIEKEQAAKLADAKTAKEKADQKAAKDAITAATNYTSPAAPQIANPKDYVDGDILNKPIKGTGQTNTSSDAAIKLTEPDKYVNRDILSKPSP